MALVQIPAPVAASGGMTEIASGSLSGASISLTSISQSYKNLVLVMRNMSLSSIAIPKIGYNDSGSGNAAGSNFLYYGTSPTQTYDYINPFASRTINTSGTAGAMYVQFNDYTSTSYKTFYASATAVDESAGGLTYGIQFGNLQSTSAVSSIQMLVTAGAFDNGTYILYGVN